jgi:hypothetical protein
MNGKDFVARLTELGYFSYTDAAELDETKEIMEANFDEDGIFMSGFSSIASMDKRFYDCGDCEELFEEGGVVELLAEMKPLFDQVGLTAAYTDDTHTETEHFLTFNGKKYNLAEGNMLMWGETFVKYADMINAELAIINKEERIYLITYDENNYMVFLTPAQHQFVVKQVLSDDAPKTSEEWTKDFFDTMNEFFNK